MYSFLYKCQLMYYKLQVCISCNITLYSCLSSNINDNFFSLSFYLTTSYFLGHCSILNISFKKKIFQKGKATQQANVYFFNTCVLKRLVLDCAENSCRSRLIIFQMLFSLKKFILVVERVQYNIVEMEENVALSAKKKMNATHSERRMCTIK